MKKRDTVSVFGDTLPEEYQALQGLHTKIRYGNFQHITLSAALLAYFDALVPKQPRTSELANELDAMMTYGGISATKLVRYLEEELQSYTDAMQFRFRENTKICPSFLDTSICTRLSRRLTEDGLERILFTYKHNGETEDLNIPIPADASLTDRYQLFWKIITDLRHHQESEGCDMLIISIGLES